MPTSPERRNLTPDLYTAKRPAATRLWNAVPITCAVLTMALSAIAMAACAGAKAQAQACAAQPRDSIYAASGPVYRDCAVDTKAKLTNPDLRVNFQPPARSSCSSAEVEFVVGTNGRPELATARTLMTNNQAFADAVLASLDQWRYEPARRGGNPVRAIVTEKRAAATVVVRVPAGSSARPPQRAPNC